MKTVAEIKAILAGKPDDADVTPENIFGKDTGENPITVQPTQPKNGLIYANVPWNGR